MKPRQSPPPYLHEEKPPDRPVTVGDLVEGIELALLALDREQRALAMLGRGLSCRVIRQLLEDLLRKARAKETPWTL